MTLTETDRRCQKRNDNDNDMSVILFYCRVGDLSHERNARCTAQCTLLIGEEGKEERCNLDELPATSAAAGVDARLVQSVTCFDVLRRASSLQGAWMRESSRPTVTGPGATGDNANVTMSFTLVGNNCCSYDKLSVSCMTLYHCRS